MPDDVVLVERDGAVGVITLNRPEYLNAMNADVLDRMHVVAKELAEDDSVRCVVITGSGAGIFGWWGCSEHGRTSAGTRG